MGVRIAIKPTWSVTTDGLRHVVVSKHTSTDGTIVKAMCHRWLIPASPAAAADAVDCPDCAPHAP